MPELERIVRQARPDWPQPRPGLESEILDAAGLTGRPRAPSAWLRRHTVSRRTRLLAVAMLLVASGTAVAVALVGRQGSAASGRPASLAFEPTSLAATQPGYLESGPVLAVDGEGGVSAVWARAGRAFLTSRSPNGDWSAPRRLSDPATRAVRPRIAAGANGTTAIVWRETILGRIVSERFRLPGGASAGTLDTRVGGSFRVVAAVREPGGRIGPVQAVSPSTGSRRYVYAPQVVVSDVGEALVAYLLDGRVWVARRPRGGAWTAPTVVSPSSDAAFELRLVSDPASGVAMATWLARSDDPSLGRRWRVWQAVRSADGSWSDAGALSEPAQAKPILRGTINGRGDAVVAWSTGPVHAATRDGSGDWTRPERLVAAPAYPTYTLAAPAVGIDGDGQARVLVSRPVPAPTFTREPGRAWTRGSAEAPTGDGAIVADAAGGLVEARLPLRQTAAELEALADDGAPRGSARLNGFWSLDTLTVGRDGTTAIARVFSGRETTSIAVAVAQGEGRR